MVVYGWSKNIEQPGAAKGTWNLQVFHKQTNPLRNHAKGQSSRQPTWSKQRSEADGQRPEVEALTSTCGSTKSVQYSVFKGSEEAKSTPAL